MIRNSPLQRWPVMWSNVTKGSGDGKARSANQLPVHLFGRHQPLEYEKNILI
ncbi:MAG: hypothetical protein K2K19_00275 [Acetatifactor sp.]|nr:hypothetical protein [Acetatifactor sp.]